MKTAAPPDRATGRRTPPWGGDRGRRITLSAGRTVVTHGLRKQVLIDLYHYFMTVRWPTVFLTFAGAFGGFNVFFALLYAAAPESVANLSPPGFWGCFFFSVETLATVGYGDMHPVTPYGHVVASVEIFIGMMSIALMTGVIFARFSRPRARFLFARYGVVRPIDGRTTLMFRAANARQNIVMEATARLRLMRDVVTSEGYRIRRIEDLELVRSEHPIFLLGWNLMHVINAASPLAGQSAQTLEQSRAVFLLTLGGTDETTGQTLMARHDYPCHLVRWNHSFHDTLHTDEEGVEHLDYAQFHAIHPLGDPGTAR